LGTQRGTHWGHSTLELIGLRGTHWGHSTLELIGLIGDTALWLIGDTGGSSGRLIGDTALWGGWFSQSITPELFYRSGAVWLAAGFDISRMTWANH